jgi:hypothetical protein
MHKSMVLLALTALAGFCQETPKPADAVQAAKSYVFFKETQAKSDPLLNEMAAFLEKNTVLYLATCDGQSPRVRPVRYTVILTTSSRSQLLRKKS